MEDRGGEIDCEELQRLLLGLNLGASLFEAATFKKNYIDWDAEFPGQVGPYVIRHLQTTLKIIRSADLPPSIILEFAKIGCEDKDLPFLNEELPDFKRFFKITYLKYQDAYFAVPFAEGEHRILHDGDITPFVVMSKDKLKRRAGGFGEVVRVMEGELGLCRKTLPAGENADKEHKFFARIPKAPHLLSLRASYIQNDMHSLIIHPWVDTDLRRFLDQPKVWSWWTDVSSVEHPRILISWMMCMAAAIATLHSFKIRHMDLKPDNIGLKQVGSIVEPYILDYGLSIQFESCSKSVTSAGAPYYSSPEKITGKRDGRKGDIFSLGVVFMEMSALLNSKLRNGWKTLVKCSSPAHVVCKPDWEKNLFPHSSPIMDVLSKVITSMLSREGDARPSAQEIWRQLKGLHEDMGWSVHCNSLKMKTPSPQKQLIEGDLEDEDEEDDVIEDDENEACDSLAWEARKRLDFEH